MSAMSAMEQPALPVWQHHKLMFPAQDVGAFGREVDTTENDIARVGFRRPDGEFEGIAAKIGEFYDLITLVVMAENGHILE